MKKKLKIFITILLILITIIPSQGAAVIMAATDADSTTLLDKPPFSYYKSDSIKTKNTSSIKLEMTSSKANKIIDEDEWFKNNKLSIKTYEVPNPYMNTDGDLPEGIDAKWKDLIITSAFYDDDYIYCTYGANYSEGYILNVYDSKTHKRVYSLDFSNYRYSPKYVKADQDYIQQRINWATIKDGILYIANSHNTYAKSSKNMNGYITAINLSDMSILWRTKSLVCNSYNFVVIGNVILCGYGFTDENDYLYQIDMVTGKALKKTNLKSAASYIIKKGNVLYVRTYNTDYKYKIIQ